MATTPGGWPYVVPADHPLEYPAASQSLANALEAKVTGRNGVGGATRSTSTALTVNTPYDVVWESFVAAPNPPLGHIPSDSSGSLVPAGVFAIARLEVNVSMPAGTSALSVSLLVDGVAERVVTLPARASAATVIELVGVVNAYSGPKRVSARVNALQLSGTMASCALRVWTI